MAKHNRTKGDQGIRTQKIKMARDWSWLWWVGGGLAVVGLLFVAATAMTSQEQKLQPAVGGKLVVEEDSYDFGTVSINGGNLSGVFVIKNEGTVAVNLGSITTSCACTSAEVLLPTDRSPTFSMRNDALTDGWVGALAPGAEATVTMIYDPLYHGPSGTGPIRRTGTMRTSDPEYLELTFTMQGTVE